MAGKVNPSVTRTRIGGKFPKSQVEKLKVLVARGKEPSLDAIIVRAVTKYVEEKWGVKL